MTSNRGGKRVGSGRPCIAPGEKKKRSDYCYKAVRLTSDIFERWTSLKHAHGFKADWQFAKCLIDTFEYQLEQDGQDGKVETKPDISTTSVVNDLPMVVHLNDPQENSSATFLNSTDFESERLEQDVQDGKVERKPDISTISVVNDLPMVVHLNDPQQNSSATFPNSTDFESERLEQDIQDGKVERKPDISTISVVNDLPMVVHLNDPQENSSATFPNSTDFESERLEQDVQDGKVEKKPDISTISVANDLPMVAHLNDPQQNSSATCPNSTDFESERLEQDVQDGKVERKPDISAISVVNDLPMVVHFNDPQQNSSATCPNSTDYESESSGDDDLMTAKPMCSYYVEKSPTRNSIGKQLETVETNTMSNSNSFMHSGNLIEKQSGTEEMNTKDDAWTLVGLEPMNSYDVKESPPVDLCNEMQRKNSSPTEKTHTKSASKTFMNSGNYFVQYNRVQRGERDYMCDRCGKAFKAKISLNRHRLIHTEVKPYACDVCDKTFNQKNNLKTHQLVHTREKSHLCETCGVSYGYKSMLKKHLLSHHT